MPVRGAKVLHPFYSTNKFLCFSLIFCIQRVANATKSLAFVDCERVRSPFLDKKPYLVWACEKLGRTYFDFSALENQTLSRLHNCCFLGVRKYKSPANSESLQGIMLNVLLGGSADYCCSSSSAHI